MNKVSRSIFGVESSKWSVVSSECHLYHYSHYSGKSRVSRKGLLIQKLAAPTYYLARYFLENCMTIKGIEPRKGAISAPKRIHQYTTRTWFHESLISRVVHAFEIAVQLIRRFTTTCLQNDSKSHKKYELCFVWVAKWFRYISPYSTSLCSVVFSQSGWTKYV